MKNILSLILALFVGFVLARLVFSLLSLAMTFVFFSIKTLLFLILIGIFTLPVYIIIKKSLFKGK